MAIRHPRHEQVEVVMRNHLDDLPLVAQALHALGVRRGLPRNAVVDMKIALDEILSNIVKYGYDDNRVHEIRIRLTVDGSAVEAEIEDDGRAFDPLAVPQPSLSGSLEERHVGGLGMHLVRRLMSEVSYQRVADRNRLVLRRRLDRRTEGKTNGSA